MNIYVQKDGQKQGPFSEDEVRQRFRAGIFTSDDLALGTGRTSWEPLSSLLWLQAPLQGTADKRKTQRICKTCGASYEASAWSWLTASGKCAECIHKEKSEWQLIGANAISSREEALKAVEYAGALYLVIFAINIVAGFLVDPIFFGTATVILVCDLAMWIMHSRVAAIILTLAFIAGMLIYFLDESGSSYSSGYMIFVLQAALTYNAVRAVFKLHAGFDAPSR